MGHSIGDLVVYAVACFGIAHFFGFPMMAVLIFMFVAISLGKQRKPGAEQFAPVYLAQTALGLRYGVASVQGRRQYMEDMHQAVGFDASQQAASVVGLTHFFAVFDGHGGKRAASWAHTHLVPAVLKELAGWSSGRSPDAPAPDQSTLDNAVISAFHSTDRDFLETALQQGIPDGSTAVTAMIQEPAPGTRKERRLLVANLGDSRCVMVRNDGSAQALSTDHKPNRPEERARIQAAGGQVIHAGCWRVQGDLAVSRAFGDAHLKRWGVSSTPDLTTHTLTARDQYVVLASDGLWDVVDEQQCASSVLRAADPLGAARSLCDLATTRGSMDNITVLVVALQSP